MTGFVTHLIVALLAGVLGALLGLSCRRPSAEAAQGRHDTRPRPASAGADPNGGHHSGERRDRWLCELNRCEQAVCRAVRVTDAVSSLPVRRGLRHVVHRMDAELPTVRTLVELGRELDSGAPGVIPVAGGTASAGAEESVRQATLRRLHRQVREASGEFTSFADRLTGVVAELDLEADSDHTRTRIAGLRARFPLLPAMSEMLAGRERAWSRSSPEEEPLVETR